MNRAEAVVLAAPIAAGFVLEVRGLRQSDRDPTDRATYSAGGRSLFHLDKPLGRLCLVLAARGVVEWFVPHMLNGAISRAALAVVEELDDARPEIEEIR